MKGVNVFDANDRIVDLLREKKVLIKSETIEHSYPALLALQEAAQSTALPEQWFLSIDHDDLRKKGIEKRRHGRVDPRMVASPGSWAWSRSRPDWCLLPPALLGRTHPPRSAARSAART